MPVVDDEVPQRADLALFQRDFGRLVTHVETRVMGKTEQVRRALICLLARGHLLIEDQPGVGKTRLAKAMSGAITGVWHRRIQGTADLLPADITGSHVYVKDTGDLTFRPGPVFANVVLFDEVNRCAPRTQSAVLEAMEEGYVTVFGEQMELPYPFMVIGTQNPVETVGTYPLPEAQLDRFMMRIRLNYPAPEDEVAILQNLAIHRDRRDDDTDSAERLSASTVMEMIKFAERVGVCDDVCDYIVQLVNKTRQPDVVRLGASTRASLALLRAAKVYAAVDGRGYVSADDIRVLAPDVLAHRLVLHRSAASGWPDPLGLMTAQREKVDWVLAQVPSPGARRR